MGKKKRTTYAKPWEGTDVFSLPENRKTVKKRVNQRFFKDGVVRQKSAHKNFIKKVVVWGFLSVMREVKREVMVKTMKVCVFLCVCLWRFENLCVRVSALMFASVCLSLCHLDFSA